MADIFKHFIRTARAYNADRAIAQHATEDALIYIDCLYFIEIHLQRTTADQAHFHDDPMISDRKLIRPARQCRRYEQSQKRPPVKKDDPVIGCFEISIARRLFWNKSKIDRSTEIYH